MERRKEETIRKIEEKEMGKGENERKNKRAKGEEKERKKESSIWIDMRALLFDWREESFVLSRLLIDCVQALETDESSDECGFVCFSYSRSVLIV